jgi:hypothetical protein
MVRQDPLLLNVLLPRVQIERLLVRSAQLLISNR